MSDPTVVALIKNLGSTADFAARYCDDLVAANGELIEALESTLAE